MTTRSVLLAALLCPAAALAAPGDRAGCADHPLELLDLLRDPRAGHVQQLGRSCHRPGPGDGAQDFQLAEADVSRIHK